MREKIIGCGKTVFLNPENKVAIISNEVGKGLGWGSLVFYAIEMNNVMRHFGEAGAEVSEALGLTKTFIAWGGALSYAYGQFNTNESKLHAATNSGKALGVAVFTTGANLVKDIGDPIADEIAQGAGLAIIAIAQSVEWIADCVKRNEYDSISSSSEIATY